MIRVALSSIIFLFDSSPSSDVAYYLCVLQERHRIEVPCPTGYPEFEVCYGTSAPVPVTCNIVYDARADRESEWYAETPGPVDEHQALMGCVLAVDTSGNPSECLFEWSGE